MYLSEGKIYFNEFDIQTLDKIPTGNWLLCQNSMTGEFYLKSKPEFKLPEKIYGDVHEVAEKYLNTFNATNKNLGILLDGMKGTGKSMLARKLCIDSKRPTIIVTDAFKGSGLVDFFSKIDQEIVIFLDEFEKIFARTEMQDGLLSLLDGAFPSKFLFILTINEMSRMNQYMINRPGRIHYVKKYKGLDSDLIKDVVDDLLENKENIDEVMMCAAYLGELSMDMLTSFIWECNLYSNESPRKLLRDLNLKPATGFWKVSIINDEGKTISTEEVNESPLSSSNLYLEYKIVPEPTPEEAAKMTEDEIVLYKSSKSYWGELEWEIKDCDIKVNRDSSIEIKLKDELKHREEDEDVRNLTLKYSKAIKYSYVF